MLTSVLARTQSQGGAAAAALRHDASFSSSTRVSTAVQSEVNEVRGEVSAGHVGGCDSAHMRGAVGRLPVLLYFDL
jgi:hypothetical protein